MNAAVRLESGLELRIGDGTGTGGTRAGGSGYPTLRLQRGLLLFDEGQDLSQEGVGFGVPVLKRGVQTVFPGAMELDVAADGPDWQVTATYRMDLVERLTARGGTAVRPRLLYAVKDSLAAVHRRVPALRRPLTATSNAVRRRLGWTTSYQPAGVVATVPVTYSVRGGEGTVTVTVDLSGVPAGPVTEVVLMNELGAGHFDRYEDSSGAVLTGPAIGSWDEVGAATASFVSPRRRLAFTLTQAPDARLLRGREAVGDRLSWAGFGYSLRPGRPGFSYEVRVERRDGRGEP